MKKLKKFKLKILSLMLIVGIFVYVLMFGFRSMNIDTSFFANKKQTEIVTIWHIETFEGGSKSRVDFLKSVAKQLEKQNEETLFMIKSINANNLENELAVSTPDIISFGYGVGKIVLPFLSEHSTTYSIRDQLLSSGMFNKKLYAVPYIVGGYCLCFHQANATNFHVGTTSFTHPENVYSSLNLSPIKSETQYEAYKAFVYDKNVKLLGTTRDLFRVSNLNNIGRANAIIQPIDTYTDLIQYLGIINNKKICQQFVELCLSDEFQTTLINYSLFSSLHNKLYFDGIYKDMENAIFSSRVPSVFYD